MDLGELEEQFGDYSEMASAGKKKYDKLVNRRGKIWGKMECLTEKDTDIDFLQKLDGVADNLVGKNKYIKDLLADGCDKEFFAEEFITATRNDIFEDIGSPKNIGEVKIEPFCVVVDMKNEHKRAHGHYFPGTPFIAIWEQPRPQRSFTVWHEKIHNYLETIPAEFPRGFQRLKDVFEHYQELKKTHPPVVVLENQERIIRKFKQFDLIDEHQGEIVAATKEVAEWPRARRIAMASAVFGGHVKTSRDAFANACSNFSTAGEKIMGVSRELQKMASGIHDKRLNDFLLNLNKKLKKGFIGVDQSVRESMSTARLLGQDAIEKTQTLFLLLKPTQYRHIKKYLQYVYGKEAINS